MHTLRLRNSKKKKTKKKKKKLRQNRVKRPCLSFITISRSFQSPFQHCKQLDLITESSISKTQWLSRASSHLPVVRLFNLIHHSSQHISVSGFFLHYGNTENLRNTEQKLSFVESTNFFHLCNSSNFLLSSLIASQLFSLCVTIYRTQRIRL